MPEKNYISQITLPGGGVYYIKDQEARDAIAAIAAGGLSFKVSTSAATTPAGVEWDDNGTTITGTLAASADTKPYIYLVPHSKDGTGAVDYYREYVTINFGTEQSPSYAWEFLGTTDLDLTDLGDLAWKDAATGQITIATADSAAFKNGTVSASATYTPAGSVSVTLDQTSTAASLTKTDYTPAGSVSVTLDQTATEATLTQADYTPEGTVNVTLGQTATNATLTTADYTPAGTISTPIITVTPSTATVEVKNTAGSVSAGSAAAFTSGSFNGGSFTQGTDTFVAPTFSANVPENTENLVLSFNAGSFTQGSDSFTAATHGTDTFTANTPTSVTLPTFNETTVVTGITSASATQPTFTGTKATDLQVTGVSYDKASVSSATFTGTLADDIVVTGVNYDKATVNAASFSGTTATNALVTGVSYDKASVNASTFTGTEATISSTGTASGDVDITKTDKNVTVTVS